MRNVWILIALGLTACTSEAYRLQSLAAPRAHIPEKTEYLEHQIADYTREPESARFRNIWIGQDGAVVCGEINGRNAYGGMTGFSRFAAPLRNGLISGPPVIYPYAWNLCSAGVW